MAEGLADITATLLAKQPPTPPGLQPGLLPGETPPRQQQSQPAAPAAPAPAGISFDYTEPPTAPKLDRTTLPLIAHSVEMVESGGRQGERSPKGAIGVMQLMPETAKDLGVDPENETQNREGGTRLLGQLFDKYDNWDDALAAYNWGTGNFDKWDAAGRPANKLPAETQRYVREVLDRTGLGQGGGSALLKAKQTGTPEDLAGITSALQQRTGETPTAGEPRAIEVQDAPTGLDIDPLAYSDPHRMEQQTALVQGARKAVTDLAVGPIQLGLEMTNPEAASQFTAKINELEESYGGAEVRRKHPAMAFAGEVVGFTGALLATKGAIGTTQVPQVLAKTLPQVARWLLPVVGGAALGGTAFNPQPEETSRIAETVMGAAFGALGQTVASSAAWAARNVSNSRFYQTVKDALSRSVEGITENSRPAADALARESAALFAKKDRLYGRMGRAGEQFDGFQAEPLQAALEGSAERSPLKGVGVAPVTMQTARKVERTLGLDEEAVRRKASERAEADYEKEYAEWFKTNAPRGVKGRDPTWQDRMLKQNVDRGITPPPPEAPLAYASEPIPATKYKAALTDVRAALGRVRKGSREWQQLNQLDRDLHAQVEAQAAELGIPAKTFLRNAEAADKFFRENIAPLERVFGVKGLKQLQALTPAQLYDKVVKLVESKTKDAVKVGEFMRVLGPQTREQVGRLMIQRMLADAQPAAGAFDPKQPAKWLYEHRETLEQVLGRERVAELQGWTKVADRVGSEPPLAKRWMQAGAHSWLPYIGALRIGEGLFQGEPHKVIEGAAFMAAPFAIHALFGTMNKMAQVPAIMPLVRAAAKTPPGPRLDTLVKVIENRYKATIQGTGRAAIGVGYSEPSEP